MNNWVSGKLSNWMEPGRMRGFLTSYRAWDEKKVVTWLHSIKCGQYESLFRGKFSFDSQSNSGGC
jgi:hypothetical protein